jgi:hypothetical protein
MQIRQTMKRNIVSYSNVSLERANQVGVATAACRICIDSPGGFEAGSAVADREAIFAKELGSRYGVPWGSKVLP